MSAPVLVAGGGIAGLAAAVALAQRGHDVLVLERRPGFEEIGAGIQLAPNAFCALDALGLAPPVLARSSRVPALRLMCAVSQAELGRLPLDEAFEQRFGFPYAVVHRGDLYGVLHDACRRSRRIVLEANCAVTRYTQHGDEVEVVLSEGVRLRGSCLVGADGLNSAVRRQVVGDGDPRLVGHTTYRAVVPTAAMPANLRTEDVVLWAGPRCHFVQYPISGGNEINLVVTQDNGAAEPLAGVPTDADTLAAQFDGIGPHCRALIGASAQWRAWTPSDRDPVDRWSDGLVGLLGDAAHPMVQYAAQGACMALEDAVALGRVADAPWRDAWRAFTGARAPRAGRVQQLARWLGTQIYHPGADAAGERNAMLTALGVAGVLDRVDWLYGGPAEEAMA